MSSPAYGGQYPEARESVLERDGWTCVHCGWSYDDPESRQLQTHHVLPRRLFEDESDADSSRNLVTLCSMCHGGWEKATRRMLDGASTFWPEYRDAVVQWLSDDVAFLEEHFPEVYEIIHAEACEQE